MQDVGVKRCDLGGCLGSCLGKGKLFMGHGLPEVLCIDHDRYIETPSIKGDFFITRENARIDDQSQIGMETDRRNGSDDAARIFHDLLATRERGTTTADGSGELREVSLHVRGEYAQDMLLCSVSLHGAAERFRPLTEFGTTDFGDVLTLTAGLMMNHTKASTVFCKEGR